MIKFKRAQIWFYGPLFAQNILLFDKLAVDSRLLMLVVADAVLITDWDGRRGREREREGGECNERKELKDSHERSNVVSVHLNSLSMPSIFNRPFWLPGSPRVTLVEDLSNTESRGSVSQSLHSWKDRFLRICQEYAQVTFHPHLKYT